jgi:hypothetical protein
MDEPGSDDKISLRAYAAELRPEEAKVAFSAANAGRKALKSKLSGLAGTLAGIHAATAESERQRDASSPFKGLFDQVAWSRSPEAELVRSCLLEMATAIVDAAATGRAIWRGDGKFPKSFFVTARDDAVQMIAEGLEQDDQRFRVLCVQAVVGSVPAKPTGFVDGEKLPPKLEQLTRWLVGKGKAYINARTRAEIANDYKTERDLRRAPSTRQIDRAKSEALKEMKNAPNRAK